MAGAVGLLVGRVWITLAQKVQGGEEKEKEGISRKEKGRQKLERS